MQNKQQRVKIETALKLKNIGFEYPWVYGGVGDNKNANLPPQAEAQKFLRESLAIDINIKTEILQTINEGDGPQYIYIRLYQAWVINLNIPKGLDFNCNFYTSYEEALEAAILKSVKVYEKYLR